jgi:hypothetical protein
MTHCAKNQNLINVPKLMTFHKNSYQFDGTICNAFLIHLRCKGPGHVLFGYLTSQSIILLFSLFVKARKFSRLIFEKL